MTHSVSDHEAEDIKENERVVLDDDGNFNHKLRLFPRFLFEIVVTSSPL